MVDFFLFTQRFYENMECTLKCTTSFHYTVRTNCRSVLPRTAAISIDGYEVLLYIRSYAPSCQIGRQMPPTCLVV
jgi:hypothetical protein